MPDIRDQCAAAARSIAAIINHGFGGRAAQACRRPAR
jgi:hypothetical protein